MICIPPGTNINFSKIKYLFLPYETSKFSKVKSNLSKPLVSHAPTNRFYKGSNHIIKVCRQLERENKIFFDLIENVSHNEALERKGKSDIFIDQDTPDKMYEVAGLDNLSIVKKVEETLNSNIILAKNKNKIS